jgi:hypothetical protein
MKHHNKIILLTLILFQTLLVVACTAKKTDNKPAEVVESVDENDSVPENYVVVTPDGSSDATAVTVEATPQQTTQKSTAKKSEATIGGRETLYISTYGANGKVWGHVTMNGRTGHGTIHDDMENSYSIKVTRHGGELFGIDQNGREYVFRL